MKEHEHRSDKRPRFALAALACALALGPGGVGLAFCLVELSPLGLHGLLLLLGLLLPVGIAAIVLAIIAAKKGEARGRPVVWVVIGSAGLFGGVELALGGLALWLRTIMPACGPHIYSFDGQQFVLDCEPYAGAILEERTGYRRLHHLVTDGDPCYWLKIANELEETHYTDELKLLVIDHPRGTEIVPDLQGQIHTVAQPIPPVAAYDTWGTSILDRVQQKDGYVWESAINGHRLPVLLRGQEEVVLEFPKPEDARLAKLVVHVCNTPWGSSLAARFLQYCGANSALLKAVRRRARRGFIRFEVQAWEDGQWVTQAVFRGASPGFPRDQIAVLDVRRIHADRLKLRLPLAAGFWRIDSAVIDYGEDAIVIVRELQASVAVTHNGQDIREALRADDDHFYVAEKGDYAIVAFHRPPEDHRLARSFIVKATGYYQRRKQAASEDGHVR